MTIEERVEALIQLGDKINQELPELKQLADKAYRANQWFTSEKSLKSMKAIANEYLAEDKIKPWSNSYDTNNINSKKVGLVLAGNIPLVGWHDVMSCFVSGHKAILKCSSKDEILIPGLLRILESIDKGVAEYFEVVERLTDMDAVIATGGDTAATHFQYYFSKYPHVIRKNRSSVAVLQGDESEEELLDLCGDMFEYFGLGCRSVSKLYVPEDYKFYRLFEVSMKHVDIIDHNKYKNNFDYSHSIYLLGLEPFLTNNLFILRESPDLSSRIACIHYETYKSIDQVRNDISSHREDIQCIASNMELEGIKTNDLGTCQEPSLFDYADGIDTMSFLTSL